LDRPGLPNARNVGIEHSRGEFVLFVDDDVTPVDEQFITEHMNNYLCPEVVGVAGRVIEKNSAVTNPECLLRITRWGTVAGGPHGVSKTTVDTMQGCNMSFRRKEALDAGLFSNCIIGSAHFEDAEFALRLRKHTGGSLVFDPNAALFHHQSPAGGCQSRSMSPLQRQFWRFHNMTFTAFENPDVISPSLFIISRLVAMLRIAVQLRSLSALYWLTYAIYLGVQTHNRREVPAGKLDFVKRHI
jgi:GT2 family glycosyltransferase